MYLMVSSRQDTSYVASVFSRFIVNSGKSHQDAAKWITRYLNGTKVVGLDFDCNVSEGGYKIIGYSDSDFAKDLDDCRSMAGYVFQVLGNVLGWKAQLQQMVALFSIEV